MFLRLIVHTAFAYILNEKVAGRLCTLIAIAITLFNSPNVFAESWFFSGNTVSTGKIIIDGQEVGDSAFFLKGSGEKRTINRKIKDFTSVSSQGTFDIKYRPGKASLTISGDDNIIKYVSTEVINHALHISMDMSYSSEYPIVINISSPGIEHLTINGASQVELDAIKAGQLKIDLLGTADLYANGTVSRLVLNVHGAGDVKMKSLVASSVSVYLQGAGDIELTANKELDAKISGVGNVVFYGNPKKINKHISGVGEIVAGE